MKEQEIQAQFKLFKIACKTMTEAQKDQIKGFRAWEKGQKKAFILTKIYMLLANKKMNMTEVAVSFRKDLQGLALECLKKLVKNKTLGVDSQKCLYIR